METYSKTSNFPNGIVEDQLEDEIIENGTLSHNVLYINTYNDNVNIFFDGTLSTPDKNTLDIIVSNHNYIEKKQPRGIISKTLVEKNYDETNYSLINNIYYPAKELANSIYEINVTTEFNKNNENYTLKIYDSTNNKTIAEQTFNNTTLQTIKFSTLNNIPTNSATLELHAKVSKKNSKINFYNINILYY